MKDLRSAKRTAKKLAANCPYPVFVADFRRVDPEYSRFYGPYGVLTWVHYGNSDLDGRDIIAEF